LSESAAHNVTWPDIEAGAEELLMALHGEKELVWAKSAWEILEKHGLTQYSTDIERHIVLVRFITLGIIYYEFCACVWDEVHEPTLFWCAPDLNINPFRIAQIAGTSFMPHDDEDPDELLECALQELTEEGKACIFDALLAEFGTSYKVCLFFSRSIEDEDEEPFYEQAVRFMYFSPHLPFDEQRQSLTTQKKEYKKKEPLKTEKSTLKQLCFLVHTYLQAYIAIHNDIFRSNLRRILPVPWLFQSVNFENHTINLKGLEEDLQAIRNRVYIPETGVLTDGLEEAIELINYIDLLEVTIKKLREMCAALHLKSEGLQYPWAEYRRDLKHYHTLVSHYRLSGEQLNSSMIVSK
jgi:hypothetical protein